MDFSLWVAKKFVALPEEFWREDNARIIAYIRANPDKVFLLSDVALKETLESKIFAEENSIRFAREIKFSTPAKLIAASKEFEVSSLSETFNNMACDENFLPTEKNFLITPDNFPEADNIRRQCFILQMPLEICSEKEFSTAAAERKLIDHAADLLQELDEAKKLHGRQSELHLAENISLLKEFFSAAESLELRLKTSDEPLKLLVAGEHEGRELLTDILERLNFNAEGLLKTDSLAEKLPNCAACIFVSSALNNDFTQAREFLRAIDLPNREKIFFVMIRPALREAELEINAPQIFLDFSEVLSEELYSNAPTFFLDAPEIFYRTEVLSRLQTDESITVDELLAVLGLRGREGYFTRLSLEKFFDELRALSNKALLQKSGVPFLESHLRQATKKDSLAEELFCRFGRAISFVEEDALKSIQLLQAKKISADELHAESLHEKILLISARGKLLWSEAAIKAILFDADNTLKIFIRELEQVVREIVDKVIRTEEFNMDKLDALHHKKISEKLKTLLDGERRKLQIELAERARKLRVSIEKIISEHQAHAEEFLDFVRLTLKNFPEITCSSESLPSGKNFEVPDFDAGLAKNFSADNLAALVADNMKIICTAENSPERFYLSGAFRQALRENLETTAQEKFAALEKTLRRNIFAASVDYFNRTSKICCARQELCFKVFSQRVEKICDELTFMNQDFAVMEEVSSALKNLHKLWLQLYPKRFTHSAEENFPKDLLERKNLLLRLKDSLPKKETKDFSTERFLPSEDKLPQATTNEDFNSGYTAFRGKKYDVALKHFAQAAALGHVESMKYLAYLNQNGLGTRKNLHAAISNYLDAFYFGDSDSCSELGEIFLQLNCNHRALEFYKVGADRGDKYSLKKLNAF